MRQFECEVADGLSEEDVPMLTSEMREILTLICPHMQNLDGRQSCSNEAILTSPRMPLSVRGD